MEIKTQVISNPDYDATKNMDKLEKIAFNNLNKSEWMVNYEETDESYKKNVLIITYLNSNIRKDSISPGIPGENKKIEYTITLKKQEATFEKDTAAGFGIVNQAYKDDLGKIVEGYSIRGIWRLFYADNNNMYLLSDSIGNMAIENLPGYDSTSISELGKNLNSKFTLWDTRSNNRNVKASAALLDKTKWLEYKADYAKWAIGAPTIEMFVASYNSTHTTKIDCRVNSANSSGYVVGKNTLGENVEIYDDTVSELGNSSDLDKAIYCNTSNIWWLSSPGSWSGYHVMNVQGSGGGTLNGKHNYSYYVYRPLVCIPISEFNKNLIITSKYID